MTPPVSSPSRRLVRLTGLAQTSAAELRTATFQGEPYLIIPVIALVGDSVIRPVGSLGPEFVPAHLLSLCPDSWNNRPVLPSHPSNLQSANSPSILESSAFGVTFNARYDNKSLKLEAWLNSTRAAKVGDDAISIIERCSNHELVEVSIGAWVGVSHSPGIAPCGTPYDYIWTDIVGSDHLAMGLGGKEGACSIEAGCGAPRLNQSANQHANASNQKVITLRAATKGDSDDMKHLSLSQRLLNMLGVRNYEGSDEGVSSLELFDKLTTALRATEPGFDWVVDYKPETKTVIYKAMPEDRMLLLWRTYNVSDDGTVTLNDDREEVKAVTRYEPVAAESNEKEETKDSSTCSCGGNSGDRHAAAPSNVQEGDSSMNKKKDLIGRLVANTRAPFVEKDRTALEALSEETLEAMDKSYDTNVAGAPNTPATPSTPQAPTTPEPAQSPSTPPATSSTPAVPPVTSNPPPVHAAAPDTVQLSREDFESMRAAAAAHRQSEDARKSALVKSLVSAQKVYSESDLKAMSIDQLEKTRQLLNVEDIDMPYDFSGRGRAIAASASDDDEYDYTPPSVYGLEKKPDKDKNGKDTN